MTSKKRRSNGAVASPVDGTSDTASNKRGKTLRAPRASTSRVILESTEELDDVSNSGSASGSDDLNNDFDDSNDLVEAAKGAQGMETFAEADVDMYSDEDLDGGYQDIDGAKSDEDVSESSEGNGIEEDHSGPSSNKIAKQSSLFAIPSRDEIDQLKNTSELYTSNIIRLKIEEMVAEVKPRYNQSEALDLVLRKIKGIAESMDTIQPQTLPIALKKLAQLCKSNAIKVPFPDPQPDPESQIKYGFEAPSRIQIVGSWILQTAARRPGGFDVDMVLTMPSSLFHEKDYMNMRYFHKRAFYLAVIASAIESDASLSIDLSFIRNAEDAWRPVLFIQPRCDGSPADFSKIKANIRIHLAHEAGLFPVQRLAPIRNNIRSGADDTQEFGTALYNSSVLKDSLFTSHLVYLNSVKARCPAFSNALVLLKTWASQRCFGTGPSKTEAKQKASVANMRRITFGTSDVRFVLTMALAHLINGPDKTVSASISTSLTHGTSKLSPGSSSFQLFRGVLDFIASHDFARQPIFMKATDDAPSHREKIGTQPFIDSFEHIMVDPTNSVNLLGAMPSGSLRFLQQEAKATLSLLSQNEQDNFDAIFLMDMSKPASRFDDVFTMPTRQRHDALASKAKFGSMASAIANECDRILGKGLADRHHFVTVLTRGEDRWALSKSSGSKSSKEMIEVGVRLNAAHAFRLVDHGPRPEDIEAAEAFKQFWGDIAELRRFRDGRVVESVVWNAKNAADRYSIPRRILQHLINRHFQVRVEDKSFLSVAFDGLLASDSELNEQAYVSNPQDIGFQGVQGSFDQLAKALRGLSDLPLSLISVSAADGGLRQASPMIPGPTNMSGATPLAASFLPAHEFVLTFESSGQWPDDINAIQAMKLAFFGAIADKIAMAIPGANAAIALDSDAEDNTLWDRGAIEIIMPTGFAFRGRIHHERERVILERIAVDGDDNAFERSQAKEALDRFERRFDHPVRHNDHFSALVARYPSLSDAVRLTKRWISSQLMSNHVDDILIELLGADVYIAAAASDVVPAAGYAGFAQIVRRLASWAWREQPLAVPLVAATSASPSTHMDMMVLRKIQTNFASVRRLDPALNHFAWFIATESEPKGCCWARNTPSAATADALQRLARGANTILEGGALLSPAHVKALFVPSLEHFDFLIHLEPASLTRYIDALRFDKEELRISQKRVDGQKGGAGRAPSKYRNLGERLDIAVGLDTGREYVRLLESLYSDTFRLYYDELGGTVIGGLFNPALASKPRPFRVGLGFNARPVSTDKGKNVVLNTQAVLEEVHRLGAGLVRAVELQRDVSA